MPGRPLKTSPTPQPITSKSANPGQFPLILSYRREKSDAAQSCILDFGNWGIKLVLGGGGRALDSLNHGEKFGDLSWKNKPDHPSKSYKYSASS